MWLWLLRKKWSDTAILTALLLSLPCEKEEKFIMPRSYLPGRASDERSREWQMDIARLNDVDRTYPIALESYLGDEAPPSLAALGNLEILKGDKLALFCSVICPPALIIQTQDLARKLTQARVAVIGGFHSPVEKECLRILLGGSQPLIVCPARSLKKMRIRAQWKKPLEDGRLLFLSQFPDNRHRGDVQMALYRNRFVAALADSIFIAYAAPSSKTEKFCREILAWQKPVYTFRCPPNDTLMALGLRPIAADVLASFYG